MSTTYFLCCATKQILKLNPGLDYKHAVFRAVNIWDTLKPEEMLYYYNLETKLREECNNVIEICKQEDAPIEKIRKVVKPLSKHKVYCPLIHDRAIIAFGNNISLNLRESIEKYNENPSQLTYSVIEGYTKLCIEFTKYRIVKQVAKHP